MQRKWKIYIACFLLLVLKQMFLYQVDERERAVVYQMGVMKYEVTKAGLHVKLPWPFQSVTILDKRWYSYESSPREVLTNDKKALMVDTVAYIRVTDGMKYIQTVQTPANAQARVDDIAYSEMRAVIGSKSLEDVVIKDRIPIQETVDKNTAKKLRDCCGMEAAFVRVIKADFPDENKASVYGRMQYERQSRAAQYRAEGNEQAQKITSDADRQVTIINAEAVEEAQKNKGAGDAEATRIYNQAYSKDPAFFKFWRSMQAMKSIDDDEKTELRYFMNGQEAPFKELLTPNKK